MVQTIFNGALYASGEKGRFCRRLRRWVLKWTDPLVTWELNGRTLRLPLSHQLPLYRREFPTYSANLERLAAVLHRELGHFILIDVGANVGDSLALAGIQPGDAALLIEGNPGYFRLLQANTAELRDAVCLQVMLSDKVGEESAQLQTRAGTGQMVAGTGATATRVQTLDSLVAQHPRFQSTQLLKIDVDGYDFRVLRGGARLITQAQPILFFEQDPRLLESAGEQANAVWHWLAEAGYVRVFLYDHFGYWLGSFPLADASTLAHFNEYSRQQTGYYYDVVAFASTHASLLKTFEAAEKQFYHSLRSPRPVAPS